MRKALGTLPWVEKDKIQTDVKTREVRFNLKDKNAWNEADIHKALKAQGFPECTVKSLSK